MDLRFLQRIDSVPIDYEQFSPEFVQWVTNLVDLINYDLNVIQQDIAILDARLTAIGA